MEHNNNKYIKNLVDTKTVRGGQGKPFWRGSLELTKRQKQGIKELRKMGINSLEDLAKKWKEFVNEASKNVPIKEKKNHNTWNKKKIL